MRVPSLSTLRFAFLVALVLALFASGLVVGAAGSPLILGQSNGSGGQGTTLTANTGGAVLKLENRGGGRALHVTDGTNVPLRITAPAGQAPISTNSSVGVTNLNADLVDGFSASSLVRIVSASSADLPRTAWVGRCCRSASLRPAAVG